jgi:muramoyltetrapeptide carboxypeptidase
MRFAPHLAAKDPVALVTSSHLITDEKLAAAIHNIQSLNLNLVYTPSLRRYGYYAGTVAERVAELNDLFRNPDIRGIFFIRGGSGALALLPELDYRALQQHPKIMMGLSDATAILNAAAYRAGIVTYHGPVASMNWSSLAHEQIDKLLFNPRQNHTVDLSQYTQTVRPGTAQGELWGGNLTVFTSLLGTEFIKRDWQNTILFLEDVGEEYYRLDRMLCQLELAGILPQIKGLLFGNFTHCQCSSLGQFHLIDIFQRYADKYQLPTLMGAPFGHAKQQLILPIGRQAILDTQQANLTLVA